jgi:hypothetical protein
VEAVEEPRSGASSGGPEASREVRRSARRKEQVVLRLLRLGIARSPAFHYEPETNGCAEKAIQTLKEQVLWIERFDTLDKLRTAVRAFGRTYNQQWLIERHGCRTPIEAREHLRAQATDETPPRLPTWPVTHQLAPTKSL